MFSAHVLNKQKIVIGFVTAEFTIELWILATFGALMSLEIVWPAESAATDFTTISRTRHQHFYKAYIIEL